MLEPRIIAQLQTIVGPENVATDRQDLICYGYDATQMEFLPDAVVHPANAEEVSQILKLANAERFPVFPRGAGSGFTGGALPQGGGIVLVTTRMNRILRIDTENLIAEVEPGVVTEQFQMAVEKLGLFYPPDPASLKFSTLGGNVAENAGGPRCVKYGVTRDFVMGLEVVLPTGDIIRTGGETYKGVVGYDLTRLICGSEGTLGVITKIIFKLLPLPEAKKTMLTVFDSIDGAAKAVSTIIGGKIIPTTLEFMDYATLQCVEKSVQPRYSRVGAGGAPHRGGRRPGPDREAGGQDPGADRSPRAGRMQGGARMRRSRRPSGRCDGWCLPPCGTSIPTSSTRTSSCRAARCRTLSGGSRRSSRRTTSPSSTSAMPATAISMSTS